MGILGTLDVCAMLAVKDRETAKSFYGGVLGFKLKSEDPYGVTFSLHNASLRISPVKDHQPLQHTVLGWNVADVPATVKALAAQGITFERYEFLEQDELGVWTSGEAKVAWFKDPDGNILSISNG